ncbi:BTB/POZ domain-containing protein [Acorus gramineus]|uniref:BTB/POZ domain-containing protein n=1 Tax=Acorus gramineus TaxID=55184 RepID=A0AAV9AGV4_ACOGR|nr:BTB/POZ domain-containing protein [Acorus gramineus]
MMKCISCKERYGEAEAGTCKECYEEASETEEELKREIDDLKSKISFLRLPSPPLNLLPFTDLLLLPYSDDVDDHHIHDGAVPSPAVRAHKAVLISRSPVFKAMLENEMEESRSGTIKIADVSYDVLRSFVHYLYTAEVLLDERMACDLLVLAEKYQVKHLKSYCEKFMTSKVNSENAIMTFAFAHQHNAPHLLESALSLILDNMDKLTERDEYKELVEKDPRLVVEIYEAYLTRQVNTASNKSQLVVQT